MSGVNRCKDNVKHYMFPNAIYQLCSSCVVSNPRLDKINDQDCSFFNFVDRAFLPPLTHQHSFMCYEDDTAKVPETVSIVSSSDFIRWVKTGDYARLLPHALLNDTARYFDRRTSLVYFEKAVRKGAIRESYIGKHTRNARDRLFTVPSAEGDSCINACRLTSGLCYKLNDQTVRLACLTLPSLVVCVLNQQNRQIVHYCFVPIVPSMYVSDLLRAELFDAYEIAFRYLRKKVDRDVRSFETEPEAKRHKTDLRHFYSKILAGFTSYVSALLSSDGYAAREEATVFERNPALHFSLVTNFVFPYERPATEQLPTPRRPSPKPFFVQPEIAESDPTTGYEEEDANSTRQINEQKVIFLYNHKPIVDPPPELPFDNIFDNGEDYDSGCQQLVFP